MLCVISLQATRFEFRFRLLIFSLLYLLAFIIRLHPSGPTLAEWIAVALGHSSRHAVQICYGLGGLIIAVGAAIRTWATAYLQGNVVHDMAIHSDRLVADGPYRHVRNPLYLGTTLLSAGVGFLAPPSNWLFLVSATLLFTLRLTFREEAGLEAAHPQSFRAFKAAVPRLIPSFTVRLPASDRRPDWLQAWLAEGFMWLFSLSLLVFALTLNTRGLNVMLFGTLFAYGIQHVLTSRRQRQTARGLA